MFRYWVLGTGYWVQGAGYEVQGIGEIMVNYNKHSAPNDKIYLYIEIQPI